MRTVGVRELPDRATRLMLSGETLVIESHGRQIGFFVPIGAKDRRAGREALDRLGGLVRDVLDQTGLDEDGLVREVERAGRLS